MKRFLVQGLFLGASISLVAGSAAAQATGGSGQGSSSSGSGSQTSGNMPSMSGKGDSKFVTEAAVGGMTEVELGKLATQKASSDSVKQFGQKMVDDHTKANDQLKEVAAKENMTVPSALDAQHQARVDKLSKLSGESFDKAYVQDQLKDHVHDVAEFKAESQKGTDPAVKQFASTTLPVLQEHLSMVKDLSKNEKSGSMK